MLEEFTAACGCRLHMKFHVGQAGGPVHSVVLHDCDGGEPRVLDLPLPEPEEYMRRRQKIIAQRMSDMAMTVDEVRKKEQA